MEKIYKNVAQTLKSRREEAGITQEKLSEASGVSAKFISDVERGVKKPSIVTVAKMARALNADFGVFSGDDEGYLPNPPKPGLTRWLAMWRRLECLNDKKRLAVINAVEAVVSSHTEGFSQKTDSKIKPSAKSAKGFKRQPGKSTPKEAWLIG
ncbi:MAG: helix-turn-helix transcriptional regulator [Endomicrobiia bacterium]|nr:helix-turn-helix transcriptional regulator [Endomicrobiia bacterium]